MLENRKDSMLPDAQRSRRSQKWSELDIHYLILETDDFIVCLDRDLDVDWKTSKKYDEVGPKDSQKHHEMLNRAASLECIPNDHHPKNVRLNFKRMVAEGVARSLDHDYDSAETMLEKARAYISDRNVEAARYWQLFTACVLGPVCALSGLGLWEFRASLTENLGETAYFLVVS